MHEEYVTVEACEHTRTECQRGQRTAVRWALGLVVVSLLTIGAALIATAVGNAAVNATQTTQIEEHERLIDRNYQQLREDIADLKKMIRERQ